MGLEWWKKFFLEQFEVSHMALELLEKLSEDNQYEYIIEKFHSEFFRQELFDVLTKMSKDGDLELNVGFAMNDVFEN